MPHRSRNWNVGQPGDPIQQYPWGWKTRPHFWNDDAVRIWQVYDPSGTSGWPPSIGWTWAQGEPIIWDDESWDLAFELTTNMELEGVDWGDAPDGAAAPIYPTLAINNGANHVIVPGFCLGNVIDAEPDGQPTANADGDDNNPPLGVDDEDGVTFNTPVIPGQNATCSVVVTGIPGQTYFLDAWVDFNGNGVWEASEKIAPSLPVTNGNNPITFPVPPGVATGVYTFARFRLSSTGGLGVTGQATDGEVEDYKVGIGFKWIQHPDLTPMGIDVNCTQPFILADDFLCTVTGRITDIHVWGSWRDDYWMPDPGAVKFRLSPDYYVFPGDWTCWEYDFVLTDDLFIQRGTPGHPVVYWLDVQAEPQDATAWFGWKTSIEHWNDDAVWGQGQEPYVGPWGELLYPPGHGQYGESIDLAFAITGYAMPVGSLTFSVSQVIPDHFWWPPAGLNEMLCFNVTTDANEAVKWETIQLTHSGTGNAADVLVIDVWQDVDGDCKRTPPDVWLGWGSYVGGVANIP